MFPREFRERFAAGMHAAFAEEYARARARGRLAVTAVAVRFPRGGEVFGDTLSTTFLDDGHSTGERRFLTIGMSALGRILVVSHIEAADLIRIISARTATRQERRFYEEDESNPI